MWNYIVNNLKKSIVIFTSIVVPTCFYVFGWLSDIRQVRANDKVQDANIKQLEISTYKSEGRLEELVRSSHRQEDNQLKLMNEFRQLRRDIK